MNLKYVGIICVLLMLFIIPVNFACDYDDNNITETSDEVIQEEIVIEEDKLTDNDLNSADVSYFDGNNENIEKPLTDDNFKNPIIRYNNQNTFYVNESFSGTESGNSTNPFKTIDSAFSNLNSQWGINNIYIANGNYKISKTISITKNLNIIGQDSFKTVIDGKDLFGILSVKTNDLTVTIINLTFTGGNTYYGGAVYNNRSTIKIINCIFKDNNAVGYNSYSGNYSAAGGALYNEAGYYRIYNSTFVNNKASSSLNIYGAAIYNDLGSLSVLNSRFISNSIYDGNYGCGAAIYNFNGFLTVSNSIFRDNSINTDYSIGGAVYNYEAHNVYVINSTFDGNKIYGNYTLGSAIANSASLLDVVNSTFCNNFANGTALENSTICHINGFYNFINSNSYNNTINDPKKYLLMCLEDQFVSSQIFDKELLGNLPSKYDLRDENLVTGAKNQAGSGACWAFTTIGALESYLLKHENITFDFSENNLRNVMSDRGVNGTDWAEGGNYQMALAYFLRWDGPVDEDDDPFNAYITTPTYGLDSLKHVQGVMFIPMRLGYLDNNQIKYAIMKYGALYASIYGTSMNSNVYNSQANIPNHAVTIVGWDDNYPAAKFSGSKPPGNGAFIIKNSWGTSYGQNGFGYVSYYDKSFAGFSLDSVSTMAFTSVEDVTNYRDIYQYDILGNTYESLGYNNHTAWLANQFTAVSDNPLSAFGLYAYGVSDYFVEVYVNGELKHSQNGNISYGGFHTIKLNKLVNLSKGDLFRINVKLTTFDSLFPIAIESQRNGYSNKATSSLNQSFISPDGINWFDIAQDFDLVKISGCLYGKTITQANVCIKAYTENVGVLNLNVVSNSSFFYKGDTVNFVFNLTNFGDYVRGINVTFLFDDAIDIINIGCENIGFNNSIWFIDDLNTNESVILNLTVKIVENKDQVQNIAEVNCLDNVKNNGLTYDFNLTYAGFTTLILKNVTSFSKSNEMVNVTLLDSFSNPISNVSVTFSFNNSENLTFKTNSNGIISVNLNLLEGNYQCAVYFYGNDIYRPINQSFDVNIIKRTSKLVLINGNIFYYGEGPSLKLTDEDNTALANRTVSFIVNNNVLNFTSDVNGIVNLSNLKSGDYMVLSSFDGDDLYYGCNLDFTISIIKKDTILKSDGFTMTSVIVKMDGKIGPYLKVILKDKQSNLLVNKKVRIKLNSVTYNVFTNQFGVASLQVNIEKSGTYNAQIDFLGDECYYGSSAVSKIIVKKKKTTLNVPKKTYKSSKKVKKLTATLKVNKGKAIAGKKVTFKINGKKYKAKTNKKGLASVKVKITKKKTYKFTVIFDGDRSFSKISKKSKLIVK